MEKRSYWIIDDLTSKRSIYEPEKINAANDEEAIRIIKSVWESLTDHDKKDRDAFYLIFTREDKDGIVDLDDSDSRVVYVIK